MTIAAIVATGLNNEIGKNNQLLWHLPADLKFFKNTTMGCPVIMGRKTFESIGRLLPGRRNLIITRQHNFEMAGAEIYHALPDALASLNSEKVFIIGGAEIYRLALPYCALVYRTLIKADFDADTFFPDLEKSGFKKTGEECHASNDKNPFDYCFETWIRARD